MLRLLSVLQHRQRLAELKRSHEKETIFSLNCDNCDYYSLSGCLFPLRDYGMFIFIVYESGYHNSDSYVSLTKENSSRLSQCVGEWSRTQSHLDA